MRTGVVHPALATEKLGELFALAAEAGAEGVEIHYASPAVATALRRKDHAQHLRAAAEASGLAVTGLYLSCMCAEPALIGRPEIIANGQKLVREALTCAAESGAQAVVIPFFGKNAIELEEELDRAANALMDLVEDAEQAGVKLVVESTLPFHQQEFLLGQLGNTGDVQLSVNAAVGLSHKFDVATGIRQLGPAAIAQVRFKDARMVEGAPPDFQVPLGQGHVDFRAIAQALLAINCPGWVIVDPPAVDHDKDPAATVRKVLAFARGAFETPG